MVGRFVVLGFLGAGGMGEVYAAYDPKLERKVAIKFLRPRRHGARHAGRRGGADAARGAPVAKLSHPNVVTVYESASFEDRLFIAMEFVDGQSVADWLRPSRARRDVAPRLSARRARARGGARGRLVHRDFKPQNVMIAKSGEVRVMDFGLAHLDTDVDAPPAAAAARPPPRRRVAAGRKQRRREARLTRTGTLLGTPAYMAPEQFLGMKATRAHDQFSFCVSLYEALFG